MKRFSLCLILFAALFHLACRASIPLQTPAVQSSPTATTAQIPISPTISPPTIPSPTSTATPVATPTTIPPEQLSPTSTPIPPPTSAPSPTPVPQLLTPIEKLAAGQIIDQSHDLLFISQNELKLWQPQSGQVKTLLSPSIDEQSISKRQMSIESGIFLIPGVHPDDLPGFTFYVFDGATSQLEEVWSEPDRFLMAYALSTDGRTIGMVSAGEVSGDDEKKYVIDLIDIELREKTPMVSCPNTRPIDHFVYRKPCWIAAVPNSQNWMWSDIDGVQIGGVDQPARLLVPHVFDGKALPLAFYPTPDWSPDGRYQLLLASRYEGSTRWILDTITGQVIEVPDSVEGTGLMTFWQWTWDNRLVTIKSTADESSDSPSAKFNLAEWWRVVDGELLREEVVELPRPKNINPVGLTQPADGQISFIINNNDPADPDLRNIYLLDSANLEVQTVASIPPYWGLKFQQTLQWTPDTSGILFLVIDWKNSQIFYIPADGGVLYDISEFLGENITQAVWLP